MKTFIRISLVVLLLCGILWMYNQFYGNKKETGPTAKIPVLTSSPAAPKPAAKTKLEKDIEKSLLIRFNRIGGLYDKSRNDYSESDGDSLYAANTAFKNLLLTYIHLYPATIAFHFDSLIKAGMGMITSGDGKFRTYSWDKLSGGTMHYYDNINQYKVGDSTYSDSKPVSYKKDRNEDDEKGPQAFYKNIYSLRAKNKTYYLATSTFVLGGNLFEEYIEAFSIDGKLLNTNARIIKTNTGMKNSLHFDHNMEADDNATEFKNGEWIKYDTASKTIRFPLVQSKGYALIVTNKTIQYQFNGDYFEKKP